MDCTSLLCSHQGTSLISPGKKTCQFFDNWKHFLLIRQIPKTKKLCPREAF